MDLLQAVHRGISDRMTQRRWSKVARQAGLIRWDLRFDIGVMAILAVVLGLSKLF